MSIGSGKSFLLVDNAAVLASSLCSPVERAKWQRVFIVELEAGFPLVHRWRDDACAGLTRAVVISIARPASVIAIKR